MRVREPAFEPCPEHCVSAIRPGDARAIANAFARWRERRGFDAGKWRSGTHSVMFQPREVRAEARAEAPPKAEVTREMLVDARRRAARSRSPQRLEDARAKIARAALGGRRQFTVLDVACHYGSLEAARVAVRKAWRLGWVRLVHRGVPGRNALPALWEYLPS